MDSKTLIKALKQAVRDVIKEELTDILREGLQSTISEMKSTSHTTVNRANGKPVHQQTAKNKIQFQRTGFADILNETPSMKEGSPSVSSFSELMSENYRDMSFSSADAQGFGMMRQNQMPQQSVAPAVMHDPETGKTFDVDPVVAKALTRDYSGLMKAIEKKKGK
jgi:hypothetical protein